MSKVVLIFVVLLFFQACAGKLNSRYEVISGDNIYEAVILNSSSVDKSLYNILQIIAQSTIKEFHKRYFFIIKPKVISNYEGRIINSVDEFARICTTTIYHSKCNIDYKLSLLSFGVYDKKPYEFIVWDAQKVLDDLKKIDKFDKELYQKVKIDK